MADRLIILNELDSELYKLEMILKRFPEDALGKSHAPGKWSPKQLIQHLIISEKLALLAVEKYYTKGISAPKAGLPARVRAIMLQFFLGTRIKARSPEPVRVDDEKYNTKPLQEIFVDWKMQRKDLKEVIFTFQEDEMRRLFFKHPVVGLLSINQMLLFFKWHFARHASQALYAVNHNIRTRVFKG